MTENKIYQMSLSRIFPLYVAKVQKKGKTIAELHEIIEWLTGYSSNAISQILTSEITLRDFFKNAPKLNPKRRLIKGIICGVRVEDIDEPLLQEIRYMDKMIDELARGKLMASILRQ